MAQLYWGDMTPERLSFRVKALERWKEARSSTSKPGGTMVVAASDTLDWRGVDYRCDGTNDEVEIQAALDAASSAGKSVLLLEGTYNLDADLTFGAQGSIVTGQGWDTILNIRTPATANPISMTASLCSISNIQILVAAGAGAATRYPNALYLNADADYCTVKNIYVIGDLTVADDSSDARQCGIYAVNGAVGPWITDNYIYGCKRHGIYSVADDGLIRDNTVRLCSGNGIYLSSWPGRIISNLLQQNHYGIYVDAAANVVVNDNYVESSSHDGILIYRSSECTVNGNQSHANDDNGIRVFGDGTGNADYNSLTGNVCDENGDVAGDGIAIEGGANANNNTILGGSCRSNTTSAVDDDGTASVIWALDGYNLLKSLRGDIIAAQGASPKWGRLAAGNAGDVLTMGASEPAWQAAPAAVAHVVLSATHTDSTAAAVARGALVTGQGVAPTWEKLVIGAANRVLGSDGTDAAWVQADHGAALTGLSDVADHPGYVTLDGARPLTGAWDAGPFEIRAETFQSDIATGTAPFTVASTTKVTNLNADSVDGIGEPDIVRVNGTHALSAAWDAGPFEIRAETFQSDIATGTAPLTVASTTVVTNLNADTVDGIGEPDIVRVDGSHALTADWDAGSFEIRAQTLESDVATGTAPLTVASTTVVTNLNADSVDGFPASATAAVSTIPVQDASGDIDIFRNVYPGNQTTRYFGDDGSNLLLEVGAGSLKITTTAGNDGLSFVSTAPAALGPALYLRHASASPAAADDVGKITLQGYNDAAIAEVIAYAKIYGQSADISDGSEDGILYFDLISAGAQNSPAAYVDGTGQIYADLGAGAGHVTIFDEHDDAMVLFQASRNDMSMLEKVGVAKYVPGHKGGWMLNLTNMAWLLAGGIYQTRAKLDAALERIETLERRQNLLPAGAT